MPKVFCWLAILFYAFPAYSYVFFDHGTDGAVFLASDGVKVHYRPCARPLGSAEGLKGKTVEEALKACQELNKSSGFTVPLQSFLRRTGAYYGVPSFAFPGDWGLATLTEHALRAENEFRENDRTLKEDKDIFQRLGASFRDVFNNLGPVNHRELKAENEFDSKLQFALISAFTPTYFDGQRLFKIAHPGTLDKADSACYPGFTYASLSTVVAALAGAQGKSFIQWAEDSLGANPVVGVWQTYYEPKPTTDGTSTFAHYHGPYTLKISRSHAQAYEAINQRFSTAAPLTTVNPVVAGHYPGVYQGVAASTPVGATLCVRTLAPLEKLTTRLEKGELTYDLLAQRFGITRDELYRYTSLSSSLSADLEPVRRGETGISEKEFVALSASISPLLPRNYADYSVVEALEAKARTERAAQLAREDAERRRQAEIGRQQLISLYAQKGEEADAYIKRFKKTGDSMVLKACTNINSNPVKLYLAIRWANEYGVTVYGYWDVGVASREGKECVNVYVGPDLVDGSVYYRAESTRSFWGKDVEFLVHLYGHITTVLADKRQPLENGEQILGFNRWKINEYREVQRIDLDI